MIGFPHNKLVKRDIRHYKRFNVKQIIKYRILILAEAEKLMSRQKKTVNEEYAIILFFVNMIICKPKSKLYMEYTKAKIAKLAVKQFEMSLKRKFPNIVSVSDAVHDLSQSESYVVVLYLKDDKIDGIPDKLKVKMPDGSIKTIATEIIKDVGEGRIHFSQQNSNVADINSQDYTGSICCALQTPRDENFLGIVTAAHIYTQGRYDENGNGFFKLSNHPNVLINGITSGKWFYKSLTYSQDMAIIQLEPGQRLSKNYKSFSNQFYKINDYDIKSTEPNVTLISKNKIKDAYILDYGIRKDVRYNNGMFNKNNVILIGTTNNRNNSKPVSDFGDSGGCVIKKGTNKLIGILLGSDDMFSFVLPIAETLQLKNFKTI
jgi:hypothetical protein